MEAQILEIACRPVPEGHSRWTIRLLEEQAKVEFDEPVSREVIQRSLKNGFDFTEDRCKMCGTQNLHSHKYL